ncbi:hypothetical protein DFA_05636 [Cavenderia fasciculata]|uniref:PH domain-containing protein n=1 Tax=Cavenderia fasciculata TaxID=261658 RepID=F4PLU9_CACFS|nr:uncharacterized protein DFA_05636 [Cavenderia fasciculata]EGG23503.1 hypothetical protein DFA_05636 [Cavenderia fasciculata]|eukprot:XP_004361354.1 hypothetical protein DFA_05636 [Cavenderia fasciculata]
MDHHHHRHSLLFDSFDQTPLHVACTESNSDIVSVLLKRGAKADMKDKHGWTPLHCSASNGNFKSCEYLIQKDPSLALVCDNHGTSAFHYLVRKWDANISPKILSAIVKHDPTIVNLTANNLETPLHHACLKNCEGSIQFLLSHKADVNRRSINGETCLTFAIRAGYKNVVKILLEHGVDEQAFEAAYQIAAEQNMEDVKTMVEQQQQFGKIRTSNEKVYKQGYLFKNYGKLKGWRKCWIILDGIKIKMCQSEEEYEQIQGEISLKDIDSISIDELPGYQYCISITSKDNIKTIFAAEDKVSMAKWALAIDGLKFKFFDSCINQFTKKLLLIYVYKENYKGGIIKSSFEEEWTYSSDGILQCTEAAWCADSGGASSMTYLWDGQHLVPQNGSHSLGWGKFNGFIFEWLLGELGERGVKLHEYYWEEMEREYINKDPMIDWKWTRHFLTLKAEGGSYFLVEGDVPEPIVFFLTLLRYSRLNAKNEIQ